MVPSGPALHDFPPGLFLTGGQNRTCINPHHLTRGDRRDNKHDDWARLAYGVNYALLPRE